MSTPAAPTDPGPFSPLARQEKQILFLLSEGRSDQEIARAVSLGEGTIRNYVHSILSKLGVGSRAEAAAYAAKHDLRGHLGHGD